MVGPISITKQASRGETLIGQKKERHLPRFVQSPSRDSFPIKESRSITTGQLKVEFIYTSVVVTLNIRELEKGSIPTKKLKSVSVFGKVGERAINNVNPAVFPICFILRAVERRLSYADKQSYKSNSLGRGNHEIGYFLSPRKQFFKT